MIPGDRFFREAEALLERTQYLLLRESRKIIREAARVRPIPATNPPDASCPLEGCLLRRFGLSPVQFTLHKENV